MSGHHRHPHVNKPDKIVNTEKDRDWIGISSGYETSHQQRNQHTDAIDTQ